MIASGFGLTRVVAPNVSKKFKVILSKLGNYASSTQFTGFEISNLHDNLIIGIYEPELLITVSGTREFCKLQHASAVILEFFSSGLTR